MKMDAGRAQQPPLYWRRMVGRQIVEVARMVAFAVTAVVVVALLIGPAVGYLIDRSG